MRYVHPNQLPRGDVLFLFRLSWSLPTGWEKDLKKNISLDQSYSFFNAILIRPIIDVDIGGQKGVTIWN